MAKLDLITAELRSRLRASHLRLGDVIPTQKQLAEEMGVAVGTIRRAILYLQEEGILSSTRGKGTVLTGLPHASPARGKRKLGLLVPSSLTTLAPITTTILQALHQECRRLGNWEPKLHSVLERPDRALLQEWAKDLDGIAVLGAVKPAMAQTLHALGKPVLFSGELLEGPCPPWASQLSIDFDATMTLALQFLNIQGHSQVTLVSPGENWSSQATAAAFHLAAKQLGMTKGALRVVAHENSDEAKLIDDTQNGNHRCTALIVEGGLRAGRLLHLALQAGLRVPQNLSILAINSVAPNLLVTTELSRLENVPEEYAAKMLRITEEMLESHFIIRERFLPRLIEGGTCAPPLKV